MTSPTVPPSDVTGQQVFRPVPTNDQMNVIADQLRGARASRARFVVLSVFLAGAVLACIAGLVLVYGQMTAQLGEAATAQEALEARLEQKDRQVAVLNETIARQSATIGSYADFQSIAALQGQIAQLEAEIAALLAQPSRANAPARLRTLPDEVEWLDSTVTALRERRDRLAQIKAEVEAWPPLLQNPRPD